MNVRNAFKTDLFRVINVDLGRLRTSKYLIKIIISYMEVRMVLVPGDSGPHELRVTAEVLQGSVLGLVLFNIFYSGVKRLDLLRGAWSSDNRMI